MYDDKIINDFMLFFVKINATGFKVTGVIHTPPTVMFCVHTTI